MREGGREGGREGEREGGGGKEGSIYQIKLQRPLCVCTCACAYARASVSGRE